MTLNDIIQGNDINVWLGEAGEYRDLTLLGALSGNYLIYFEGDPLKGDVVTIYVLDASDNTDTFIIVVDENETLASLISRFIILINASAYFRADDYSTGQYSALSIYSIAGNLTDGYKQVDLAPKPAAFTMLACSKSDTFNLENEFLEITQTDAHSTSFTPTFQNSTMSIEQAVVVDINGKIGTSKLEDWAFSRKKLSFKFERPNGGNLRAIKGSCFVRTMSIQGGVNTSGLATFELICSGQLSVTNTPVVDPPDPIVTFDFYFGYTNLNTVDNDPLANDYLNSLASATQTGSGTLAHWSEISVVFRDPNPVVDRVYFLFVPETQAPFTMWSEIDNPDQQNQPISQGFEENTVIFRIGGYYFTRSQTMFTGNVRFHR